MSEQENRFRGPQGCLHIPRWSSGCYHRRAIDCCWVCLGRLVASGVRQVIAR